MSTDTGSYFLSCPHCDSTIEVPRRAINCKIFRCGAYRRPGLPPINPHTPKEECERLVEKGLIHGCGKPFRFDGVTVEKCDYC